ncbi:GerW family sporulation protein [Methanococcoides alaskense]|uniref:Sporulation protein YtfJ n=1 Tax=Methanococcoides alaskense TaxID=325778 RepID=A0AA90ZCU2_9EURY|nr:spore germination protein GerW family protein [Methanococcoides alaskense]MDA0524862.1 spore germination protein GerW family protein [Methanococcoides alaskense]MDR6223012.1 sporulation protein YtfJ [Methanococcoides alaskense]
MGLEDVMKEVTSELERLVSAKTVVGEPVIAGGKTILPITKVSFGFGSGGGEGSKDGVESGFGGGGGGGAKIEPVAFLVISDEGVRLMTLAGNSDLGKLLDAVPGVYEKIRSVKGKMKKDDENKGASEDAE